MLKQKRSQVQIGETVGVIMFFTLIMILTLTFIVKQNASSQQKQLQKQIYDDVVNLAKMIQTMNELRCSKLGTETLGCLDLEKIKSFYKEINQNDFAKAYYKNIFKFSKITIKIVYAYSNKELKNYTLYNNTNNLKDSVYFAVPIQIYNPVTHKNLVGLMEIEYYVQK